MKRPAPSGPPQVDHPEAIFFWGLAAVGFWLTVLGWIASPWLSLAGALLLAVLVLAVLEWGSGRE